MSKNKLIIGSRLCADKAILISHIDQTSILVQQTLESDAPLYIKHNIITAYTALRAAYSTGHRPVGDMFCFRSDLYLNQNYTVINDKVSSDATANRICWFSDNTKQQLNAYFQHINNLAHIIYDDTNNKILANNIISLTSDISSKKQPYPLFFLLDSKLNIKSASASQLYKILKWPYEDNHNRHFLETILFENNVDHFLIDLQLGHQQLYSHLLGSNTSWSIYECQKMMIKELNKIDEEFQWPILSGLKNTKTIEIPSPKISKPKKLFGHLLRKQTREDKLITMQNEVHEVFLGEIQRTEGIDNYLGDKDNIHISVSNLLDRIDSSDMADNDAILHFMSLLEKKSQECKVSHSFNTKLFAEEPSPIPNDFLSKYLLGVNAREDFIRYLINTENESFSTEKHWALITISSILFGGMINEKWTQFLLKTGPVGLKKIKNWIYYVDIWTNNIDENIKKEWQSPAWRWQPDSLTKTLILKMLRCSNYNKNSFSFSQTNRAFNRLAKHVFHLENNPANAVKVACSKCTEYWIYYYPAFIRDIFLNKNKSTPLPEIALARLLYGTRLPIELPITTKKTYHNLTKNSKSESANLKEYLILIRAAINENMVKNIKSRVNQLKALRQDIRNIHHEYFFPDIALALSSWIINITINGLPRKKAPALKTIKDYFNAIAEPLIITIGLDKLSDFNDEEVSAVYKFIINIKSKMQHERAHQIFQFNKFLSNSGYVDYDDLDWGFIAGSFLTAKETKVDSNIITPQEYKTCLKIIQNLNTDEYSKTWMSLFLIIGYRFALRISEIQRLRIEDIQQSKNNIIIQIVNSRLGRTKTTTSVRQVLLLGQLSELESKLLNGHLNNIRSNSNYSINDLIFHSFLNKNEPIPFSEIWQKIHNLIRHVTGDNRIRFQHLRHSYITGQFINIFQGHSFRIAHELDKSPWTTKDGNIMNNLLSENSINTYVMSALSATAGHSMQATTLFSYVHLADDIAVEFCDKAPYPKLSIEDLAKISGYSVENLKSRSRKNNLNKAPFNPQKLLKKIRIGNEIDPYKYKLNRWPSTVPEKTINTKLSLKDIYTILKQADVSGGIILESSIDLSINLEIAENLINIAARLQKELAYFPFSLQPTNKNWLKLENNQAGAYNFEKNRLSSFLELIEKSISTNSSQNLNQIIDYWESTVKVFDRSTSLIFEYSDELEEFLSLVIQLGYSNKNFNFSYPNTLEPSKKQEIKQELQKIGINKYKEEKIRRLSNGSSIERLSFIKMDINKKRLPNGLPTTMATFSLALFLTSIYFEMNNKND